MTLRTAQPAVASEALPEPPEYIRQLRPRRWTPRALRGKPLRRLQRELCQRLYRYPHRNLLAMAQAKSGSTWLFRMLCEVPGYLPWSPPTVKTWTDHHLRLQDFSPPPAGYTVTKTHTPPTADNVQVVHALNRPYVTLIRDVRDLAVSWAYYVANKRDCRYHRQAAPLNIDQRLRFYIEHVAPKWIDWAMGWREALHPQLGLMIRYEDMLEDCFGVMRRVFAHYKVGLTDERVRAIVEKHRFERVTGRRPGEADPKAFNRKGVAGDWRNHFRREHITAMKRVAGEALIALGYERDEAW